MNAVMKRPCPECDEGTVTETLRYAQPPIGAAAFADGKRAWPLRDLRDYRVVEVEASRRCCRCGGRGELT